jgi:D-glycero-alpha-D-manno-heptose-7-phosphate kinase
VIVTRTPFRVTLGGGGTDLPSYYTQHGGFIFAMGLDKYMYVTVNRPTVGSKIRLHYSQSEVVDDVSELRHELAREALRAHGVRYGFEVASIADLPAGTGLGSSSCYLKQPIGKQDQYMAAYGGLTVLEIAKDGTVAVRQLRPSSSDIADFVSHTHIYYTGEQRDAREVLHDQNVAMQQKDGAAHDRVEDSLSRIKDLGYRILDAVETSNFDKWGQMLDEHWQNKKRMSKKISLAKVDQIYDEVRQRFGVLGGKIIGAGGGGFLMLYCPGQQRPHLERFMDSHGMPRMHYMIEPEGTKVVAQMGHGFLSPHKSLAMQESA